METRDKILKTSIELFNNQGVHSVGVREIARALGISPGNLSYHFPKKADIILALMDALSEGNNKCYAAYAKGPVSLQSFLHLYEGMFSNQFKFRGLLIGNTEITQLLQKKYDYNKIYERRVSQLRSILDGLIQADLVRLTESGQEMFLSYLTFFGRSWIHESFIYHQHRNSAASDAIGHYLKLLKWQLSLIATEKGRGQLEEVE